MASMEESSVKTDGQLWSVWAESIGYKTEENEDDGTQEEKKKRESDAMKLRQEDMSLFGFCPAWDDFYLVVCELCSHVIKPQALKNHIELRHGNSTLARSERPEAIGQHSKAGTGNKGGSSSCQMALGRTSSVSHSVKSNSPSHPPSRSHTKPGSSHCHGNPSPLQLSSAHNAVTSSKSKPENSSRLKRNSMAPFVRVERMPDDILKTSSVHAVNSLSTDKKELPSPQQPPPPNLNISSLLNISGPTTTTTTITTTTTTSTTGQSFAFQSLPSCFTRTLNSGPSENCSMPLNPMGADSVSTGAKKQSTSSKNKKVPKERKLLLCKDREYDPNKHCGVKVAETGKPCTRSLTCKTHSLSLRRAVVGRKKNFDELLQDHRAAKEAAQKASQSQASGATQHQTNDSCQISQVISESVGIPNASAISSKPGSGTKSSGTSSTGFIKSANKQVLKSNKHASSKAISPAIPVNRPSSHNVESSKPPSLLSENQLQQRLQESAAEPSAPKLSPQDTRYVTHHPKPSAICTFGLRQLGNGLFLLDRRWDLPRAALRAAVCTERANHPPPLKKLCIESKLPPESVDPNDPYSFTCSEPSSSQPSRSTSSVIGDIKTVVSTPLHSSLARPAVTVNSKSSLSNSSVSTGPKSFQSKSVSNKVKVREKTVNVSRNGSSSSSNPAKKKRNTAPSSGSTSGGNVNRTSNISFPTTSGGVALTTQTVPLLPLTFGDKLGALSQLHVQSTHLVANRNNLTFSPAVIRSQGMATLQNATSGRGTKDGTSVVVTGVDVLNGQLPVPSALLHSVTVSRPCGAMPTLLATSGGLGITVGTAGLVGQLSHIQKTANTSETELTTSVLTSSKGSNKKVNAVTSVGVPNSNLTTTTCTAGSTWSSAKAKTKIRKPSSGKSVILNHTTGVTHALGVGLLLESGGNVSANNGGINNHTSPQMLSSPSATPSPLLRSDSVSPQVPVSSPLHNGLGPSPPPPFLSQKGIGSNASGTNIVNHTASVSPASRTSTPSPSTDLSSPGSTGSGPKGKRRKKGLLETFAHLFPPL